MRDDRRLHRRGCTSEETHITINPDLWSQRTVHYRCRAFKRVSPVGYAEPVTKEVAVSCMCLKYSLDYQTNALIMIGLVQSKVVMAATLMFVKYLNHPLVLQVAPFLPLQ